MRPVARAGGVTVTNSDDSATLVGIYLRGDEIGYNGGVRAAPDIEQRQARVTDAWQLGPGDAVLVSAGGLVAIPGTDQHYPFRVHPDFRYLADLDVPDGVLAYDAGSGEWTVFTPRVDVDDRIWHTVSEPIGEPIESLDRWVAERSGTVHRLGAGAPSEPVLQRQLDECRVRKDPAELDRMRAAAAATARGFESLVADLAPGRTEHQLRATVDAAFMRAGAQRPAYDSIVAVGTNAAVLHSSPGDRPVAAGDFVLVDAGASVDGYACDVTRTWVLGEPGRWQRFVWDTVVAAQQAAVERCVPGVEYRELHLDTATAMARSFVEAGILRGEPADLVARGAMALFFPHGVGHLIGLVVHDVAGYAAGRERSAVAGLRLLRTDRPLESGIVVTIEPGIYFIDALLADPAVRTEFGGDVDWKLVDSELLHLGGVRIEDTVHVTNGGPEVLSAAIPKVLSV